MYVIHNFSEANLDPAELKQFFISHLNRIYCAKNQLADKLPVIAGSTHSPDLRLAVSHALDCVSVQTEWLEEIYDSLDASYTPESCVGLLGFLDEAFQSIGPRWTGLHCVTFGAMKHIVIGDLLDCLSRNHLKMKDKGLLIFKKKGFS